MPAQALCADARSPIPGTGTLHQPRHPHPTDHILLDLIETLAHAGKPSLSNAEFAGRIQGMTKDGVMHAIRRLAMRGLIQTEVIRARRRIYVCQTGKWTDFNPTPPCGASNWLAGSSDDITRRKVTRDPCFQCGVRADIGCRHQRA